MDVNPAVKLGSYPIYILGASSDPEEIQAPNGHVDFSMQVPSMAMEPSFPHIKRFIVSKDKQPDDKNLILASPLISWLPAAADKALRSGPNNLGPPPYFEQMLQKTTSTFVVMSEKFTLPDGAVMGQFITPFYNRWKPSRAATHALHLCLSTLCYNLRELYREGIAENPGRIIRLPLSQIRCRDIVMYRFLKAQLAEAGLSSIKVLTDNVQRAGCKEATTEPIDTFCAHCLLLSLRHKRCSGCMVAFYCSADCQKKGWIRHKVECKERQKEQEEWDAMLAGSA